MIKSLFNLLFDARFKTIEDSLSRINDSLRVKAGRGLVNWLLWVSRAVLNRLSPIWVRASVHLAKVCFSIYRHQGVPGVVKYLKTSQVMLMQSLGGYRVSDLREIGGRVSRTSSGLPRIIPRVHRDLIRAGNTSVIRVWMTLLALFRVLSYEGQLKTSTITDPGKPLNPKLVSYVSRNASWFWTKLGVPANPDEFKRTLPAPELFRISRSSPIIMKSDLRVSTSIWGVLVGALRLWRDEGLRDAYIDLAKALNAPGMAMLLAKCVDYLGRALGANDLWLPIGTVSGDQSLSRELFERYAVGPLGKLGLKNEPAGKIRVFAMVDCWTQWLLRPLHNRLFEALSSLPMDGTFDQLAPIRRLLEKGHKAFYSYDLSAATDRLPLVLQKELLKPLLGVGVEAWGYLLVGRSYRLKNRWYRYAVGQPMGALSSWAMLAATHHYLIQLAARRIGLSGPASFFSDYAVLGDDVVIANGQVAREYRTMMAEIGVSIGIAKSLISRNGSLEFAKRFYYKGEDCSPVAIKEIVAARVSLPALAELRKKFRLSLASVLAIKGYGYKVRGSMLKNFKDLGRHARGILLYCSFEDVKFEQWVSSIGLGKSLGWDWKVWVKMSNRLLRNYGERWIFKKKVLGNLPLAQRWLKDARQREWAGNLPASERPTALEFFWDWWFIVPWSEAERKQRCLFLDIAKLPLWDPLEFVRGLNRIDGELTLLAFPTQEDFRLAPNPTKGWVKERLRLWEWAEPMRISRPLVWLGFFDAPFEVKTASKEMKAETGRGWVKRFWPGFVEIWRLTVRVGLWFLVGYSYASFEAWELARVGGLDKLPENLASVHPTVGCICSADVLDSLSMVTEKIIRDDHVSWHLEPKDWAMIVVGFGLLLALIVYGISKGSAGGPPPVESPQLDVYDPIVRYTAGIQGPFSPSELVQLEEYLAVQAWEANLALSPIGRLWGDVPWETVSAAADSIT